MKKLSFTIIAGMFLLSGAGAFAQRNTSLSDPGTKAQVVAPNFPRYIDTGNPQQDVANYNAAKTAWVNAHPAEYAQMTNQAPVGPTIPNQFQTGTDGINNMDESQIDNVQDKLVYLNNRPDGIISEQQLNRPISEHDRLEILRKRALEQQSEAVANEQLVGPTIPAAFNKPVTRPQFVDTGNPVNDMAAYNQAKAIYKAKTGLDKNDPGYIDPTKPVFVNTGNPQQDMDNYNRAKAAYQLKNKNTDTQNITKE